MSARFKQYAEVAIDVAVACGVYYWLGWIGLALWVFFVISWFLSQLIRNQQVIMDTLLSGLPNRCSICHREIVDERGVFDEDGIYHESCFEQLPNTEETAAPTTIPIRGPVYKPRFPFRRQANK